MTARTTGQAQLLDSTAVAARLGVKRQTVLDYVYRGSFPQPDSYVGRTPVWFEQTVASWLAAHRD